MLSAHHDDNLTKVRISDKKKPTRPGTIRQLNIWIRTETKTALEQQARLEHRSMAAIVDELIQSYTSHQQGDQVENQGLPLIREVVVTEIRRALAQHRLDLNEDMQLVILEAIKLHIHQGVEQLTRIIEPAVRLGRINRRLIYALISHAYGEEVAMQEDDAASGKIGKATPLRSPAKEG
jgi:hypothetical protein